jgi:hypothetical protein
LFFIALLLIAVWAMDDLRAWTRTWFATPAIAGTCPPPSEHEQLHVVSYWRDGRLLSECMYVGSRGAVRQLAAAK